MYNHDFMRKIKEYILSNRMLSFGDTVVLGVSGGADSVALLLVFCVIREEYDLSLSVVHVNHGLRKEATEEAEYVKELCETLKVPFFLREADIAVLSGEMGKGTEETGRIMRYRFFEEAAKDGGKIAVAHNMNDLAETMLFNLCRGTGTKGLEGIAPVRGNIIRPLLCVTRAEIEEFLGERKVSFCIDKSNLTGDYTRNRIRNNIIPLIERDVQARAVPHMFETAGIVSLLNDFAGEYTAGVFERIATIEKERVILARDGFFGEHPYVRVMLIKHAIDTLVPGNRDITATHLRSVCDIATAEGNRAVNLPYGIRAVSGYETLKLERMTDDNVRKPNAIKPTEIVIPGETKVRGFGTIRCTLLNLSEIPEISRKEYTKCVDYDRISRPMLIRNRQSGDMIAVAENGHKKLKDFFIDTKIDRELRDSIPIIASGSEVVWVVGLRLSAAFKVTEATRRVLVIDVIKEEIC